jgi:hypothetical protein
VGTDSGQSEDSNGSSTGNEALQSAGVDSSFKGTPTNSSSTFGGDGLTGTGASLNSGFKSLL